LGAVGFFIMFLVISGIHVALPEPTEHTPMQQLAQGIQFIWHNSLFKWMMGLTFAGMLLSQSYAQILPAFVGGMGLDAQAYGYLLSAGGVGAIIGTLVVGGWSEDKPIGHYMFACATLSGLALVTFAWVTGADLYAAALGCVFVASAFSSIYMIISMTILQMRVPDHLRGRVMGIHSIGFSLIPLGGLLLGSIAEKTGPGAAVLSANGVYLLIVVSFWAGRAELRQLTNRHR